MKKLTFLLLSVVMVACTPKMEKGKLLNREQFQALNEVKENNNKRFSIAGYPFIDGDLTVSQFTGDGPQIQFFEEPGGKGMQIGQFPIAHGKGKNEFYTPKEFTMHDVLFYDNEGRELKADQKIQVSFTMSLQVDRERMKFGDKLIYYGSPVDVRLDKAE